ncbi:MAG: hypothetical protein VR70_01445 [Rhodospirillaceae bacterium BRH_c57]|nr:MAG: hypothetical protein VR70_01445 [Rhodospirillaceae bacterium BRH_c57]
MAWKKTTAAWAVALFFGATAHAAEPAGEPLQGPAVIAARQETMRQMEAIWLMLDDMIERDEDLDRKAAADGAAIMVDLFGDMQRQYPEGSFLPPTAATLEVRQDWSDFLKMAATAQGYAMNVREAVLDGDRATAATHLAALEVTCSTCHLRFSPGIRSDLRPWPQGR